MTRHNPVRAPVETSLNFLRPMEGHPVAYQCEPPPGVPVRTGDFDPYRVSIHDARPIAGKLSLDVEGFVLIQAPSDLADFDDEQAIHSVYYRQVERLIAAATGATMVINFDHNIRSSSLSKLRGEGTRGPVLHTHNDYSARSGRNRARYELEKRGLDVDTLLKRRFAIINLWRPIKWTVEKSPLALSDATTIRLDDLVASDVIYPDRIGQTFVLSYNPGQRWYYFPWLTPDEAIMFKVYDSGEKGVARFTPHAAFNDPTSPPQAPERESIEARALVIYDSAEG